MPAYEIGDIVYFILGGGGGVHSLTLNMCVPLKRYETMLPLVVSSQLCFLIYFVDVRSIPEFTEQTMRAQVESRPTTRKP